MYYLELRIGCAVLVKLNRRSLVLSETIGHALAMQKWIVIQYFGDLMNA